ncbi:unnamed protein product [Arctia plantaginis]|uniref:Uncharacterized protein n=1 Tax=Arctia plantaginis TaxID=874455 RepID=A0A8S0Z5Y2_ARCPL|nr:unnamed protein product [Arctia plantaginis]
MFVLASYLPNSKADLKVKRTIRIKDPYCPVKYVRMIVDAEKYCIPCENYEDYNGRDRVWKSFCARY